MLSDDLQLAVAHYALMFPTVESMGDEEDELALWRAEYDRVAAVALDSTLAVGTSDDGSSLSALRNFDQRTLMRALHVRRHQLDPEYTAPFDPLPAIAGRRLGILVRLGH